VLKGVGAILREEARTADVVGRYGGEEFVIVLSNADAKGAALVAERIRKRVESSEFLTVAGALRITLSLGVASYPRHGADVESLLQAADGALYSAKHLGRNRVVIAEPVKTPVA